MNSLSHLLTDSTHANDTNIHTDDTLKEKWAVQSASCLQYDTTY